jgi:hypothetical protein
MPGIFGTKAIRFGQTHRRMRMSSIGAEDDGAASSIGLAVPDGPTYIRWVISTDRKT